MQKEQAKEQMTKLQAKMDKLKAIIEAPDKPLNPIFIPKANNEYYYLAHRNLYQEKLLNVNSDVANVAPYDSQPKRISFRTKEAAEAWADAFQVMLELRMCEGAVDMTVFKPSGWKISAINGINMTFWLGIKETGTMTPTYFTPVFDTYSSAQYAIEKVGVERVVKLFKTIRGIYS